MTRYDALRNLEELEARLVAMRREVEPGTKWHQYLTQCIHEGRNLGVILMEDELPRPDIRPPDSEGPLLDLIELFFQHFRDDLK